MLAVSSSGLPQMVLSCECHLFLVSTVQYGGFLTLSIQGGLVLRNTITRAELAAIALALLLMGQA